MVLNKLSPLWNDLEITASRSLTECLLARHWSKRLGVGKYFGKGNGNLGTALSQCLNLSHERLGN